jgi:hypothetical protein
MSTVNIDHLDDDGAVRLLLAIFVAAALEYQRWRGQGGLTERQQQVFDETLEALLQAEDVRRRR